MIIIIITIIVETSKILFIVNNVHFLDRNIMKFNKLLYIVHSLDS